jgi:exodeoxyribonuclease V alpha subunit
LHALNERVQTLLQARGLLNIDITATAVGQNRWYVGRPVMISRNDYELNLFNGDIGIAMMVESASVGGKRGEKELKVCFIDSAADAGSDVASDNKDSKIRQLLPTRLPEHETAFAMTVHKSQGSEFEDVALVLPDVANAVISRELIYTAITRGKKTFSLYANKEVLEQGINSRIERASGLRDLLFKPLQY